MRNSTYPEIPKRQMCPVNTEILLLISCHLFCCHLLLSFLFTTCSIELHFFSYILLMKCKRILFILRPVSFTLAERAIEVSSNEVQPVTGVDCIDGDKYKRQYSLSVSDNSRQDSFLLITTGKNSHTRLPFSLFSSHFPPSPDVLFVTISNYFSFRCSIFIHK